MQNAKKPWMKLINKFVLPVAVLLTIGFVLGFWYGFLAVLIFTLFKAYQGRAGIYSAIGKIVYARGSIKSGLQWFERAYKTGKASPRVVISYAYLLLKLGDADHAESILKQLLDTKISQDEVMFIKANLALITWRRGDLDGAIAALEEVCATIRHTITYGSLGYLKILKGDLEDALRFNLEALDYNGTNSVIQDNLGQNYYLLGEYEKAEEVYRKLLPSNPTFPEAYYNYGLVLFATDRPAEALENMKKALQFEFSYLSAVTREEIETKIKEVEEIINQSA